jgi:predicted ArsR family transcriptional regulator
VDPNEVLRRAREAAELIGHEQDLVEAFRALDEWITAGGFLPDAWTRRRGIVQLQLSQCPYCEGYFLHPDHIARCPARKRNQ